jgi:hypothetical protein
VCVEGVKLRWIDERVDGWIVAEREAGDQMEELTTGKLTAGEESGWDGEGRREAREWCCEGGLFI